MVEGTRRSPATLREEIDTDLRLTLTREGCTRPVQDPGAPPGSDAIFLRVLVDDYREETLWDIGIVQRAQPQGGHDPEMDRRVVLDVTAQVELRTAPERAPLRVKTFPVHITKTPQFPGEDAAAEGRAVLVDKLVKEVKAVLCKGSRSKLLRDIANDRPPKR